MKQDNFINFMNGFAGAYQLLDRSAEKGCFIEYVCLATSVIDAFLRIGIVLKHQLDTKSREIPIELVYQGPDDKIISEREIYAKALDANVIDSNLSNKLEALYKKRNNVVHRYIISEITTEEVLRIGMEYEQMIYLMIEVVRKFEDQQIQSGIGMTTGSSEEKGLKDIVETMVSEKHGYPKLAKELMKNSSAEGET